jgi:autotransporter translocation and assembly factor TamB
VLVSAHARRLREDRARLGRPASVRPVDGTLEARWDGERAAITFALDERERRPRKDGGGARAEAAPPAPAHLRGLVLLTELRATDLLLGTTPLPWRASAELEAESLPLAAIPASSRATRMSGRLSGRARLRDVNQDPSFELNAHVDDFGVGGASVENVDVTTGGRDRSLFARASIADRSTQATIQLASSSLRMKGTDVSWDASAPTRLDYAVQNGRLALVAPLVKRTVSEIDGRVDGAGSVTIEQGAEHVEGGLAVQDARLYVNVLGEEISSLGAIAKFEPNGAFRIQEANGKMGTGEFRASASGTMKGLRLDRADVTLLATKDGIPISAQGAKFADATGEVHLEARLEQDALVVDAQVSRAVVSLPKSTQTLQPLDPDPTISIGVRERNGKLDTSVVRKTRGGAGGPAPARPEESLDLRMTVDIGKDVRLEGRGLDLLLGGRTLVELTEELRVTGRIDLRGGSIEVHGRRFSIDHGTVTFPEGGDPGNPTVVAAAYWDAPDRTRVWVDYAGPLDGGHLTLRSVPQLSPNEILSVLLFGRTDPNQATAGSAQQQGQSSELGASVAMTGGFLATDLNKALSEIDPNLDVATDTLSGNRVRAKIGRSFFDRRLKVSVGVAPGRATYRDPDTTFLFLNWQFVPKWSLVATGGDTGTTILDVLFQHRY